ncbi:hypothetical protein T07_4337 [Trichinella nelsoni]|uniref:Uncharacterized protein n=1 Tax=Trichinella nelsoni TaxID=6336 RepID=A0A0V0SC18_9BILA|nr:hypothetical protein T07_4337 [Trichinella nelsoni]
MRRQRSTRFVKNIVSNLKSVVQPKILHLLERDGLLLRHGELSTMDEHKAYRMEKTAILKKQVRSAMYKQRAKRFPRLSRDRHDLVLAPEFTRTSVSVDVECVKPYPDLFDGRRLAAMKTWATV